MTDQQAARCPACDTENAAHATFCNHCGKPMGAGAAAAPSQTYAGAVGAADRTGAKGYIVAAVAVAAVLVVGGALVLLADADEGEDAALVSGSTPISTSVVSDETLPETTEVPTTPAPTPPPTQPPTTPATTAPATTAPPTAPPPTAPPAAAPPAAAPPTVAPQPTSAPTPSVTLSFDQAASFYRSYIATAVNGEYNAAWNMLSSSDQADYTNGFDQFVGFWRSVSFADVQGVASVGGSAGFQSLAVDMAYGQVDGDPTSLEVIEVDVNVRPDGSLQIFDYRYIRNQ